ncbi:methyltransferase family protein [Petropleomorpha daqingensis]|uniref:Protein-S-isoprenylcysteine O-methyltransferase Ste14 n=1 Tax=Petropleomorpha daqingensis TaxID=2026353 RepID=A0A853CR19_9ACTN|nr:isoprenylcysteine carboxylmethyltransferase family protein [Petropleomorpha daqingensis]NYJ08912.1 protein-S-isoprenylcysteine O-methyltransferase Ste14 [Petropleomorpha daqingensis]
MRSARPPLQAYAVLAYAAFLLASAWGVGFLANLSVAPTTVDGPLRGPRWESLLIDAALLLLFAVQHSVMARAGFKRRLARVLPEAAERSTFVLASALLLALLFWQWRPLPGGIWTVSGQPWVALLWVLYGTGWVLAFSATAMVDHWDFLGLRQASWDPARGPYVGPGFSERWLYAWVRHPLMLGLLIAFWATPRMTVGHLFFAIASTGYIAVGVRFEERDLRRRLGPVYDEYADRVPAVVPGARRPRRTSSPAA